MAAIETTSIPLGFSAPSFCLPDARSGEMVRSEDLFGQRPTLVVFMCNHCPFVVHVLPALVELAATYKELGVQTVAISSNDVVRYPQDGLEYMTALAGSMDFSFPYLYDASQEVARAYDAACTPDFSIFDAHGQCVYRGQFDGSRPGNDVPVTGNDVRKVLDLLMEGHPVPSDGQLPSIGCNIKWKE